MQVLVVDAFDDGPIDSAVVAEVLDSLRSNGHSVTHRRLVGGPFESFMSAAERHAYHEPEPLITPETQQDAAALKTADALLFCYPTVLYTVPAILKGWLERVLVPGVAFVFDDKGRVRPGMTNIRRIGAVTTTPHSRWQTARRRDAGRRTAVRNIRLSCHRLCRSSFVALEADAPDLRRISQTISGW